MFYGNSFTSLEVIYPEYQSDRRKFSLTISKVFPFLTTFDKFNHNYITNQPDSYEFDLHTYDFRICFDNSFDLNFDEFMRIFIHYFSKYSPYRKFPILEYTSLDLSIPSPLINKYDEFRYLLFNFSDLGFEFRFMIYNNPNFNMFINVKIYGICTRNNYKDNDKLSKFITEFLSLYESGNLEYI